MAEIEVRNLHFHYTPGTPVLRGIDLDVGPGAVAIVGQNGAGKSTFVRLLNGLLKPVAGQVLVDGVDTRTVSTATMARQVGLVFQNPADQIFKSRVLDEVMVGPLNLQVPPDAARERALAALREVGLEEAQDQNPHDLGLADRKLVTVAGVLAMDTPVVVLDEPTIAQDLAGVRRLGEIVARLAARGKTVITITHDMDFVAGYFPRVVVFSQGQVLADGSAAAVFFQEELMARAGLEPPSITVLGRALGLPEPVLTVEALVAAVGQKRSRGR